MKVLVINGSPKGKNSNTMHLTHAFLEGLGARMENAMDGGPAPVGKASATEASALTGDSSVEVREVTVAASKIGACKGCFCCWNKTPGKCIIADDMASVIENEIWADVIIWSFPLYYFSVPGCLKNLIDRQLPISLPFMSENTSGVGSGSHPARYDMGEKRHVIISTCGFYSAEKNYDSVKLLFNHFCGKDSFEMILCGQGELFGYPELRARTDEYLESVKKAGREFAAGQISGETKSELSQLLFPKDQFEQMANASWGLADDGQTKADETLSFTRQMAAMYNKNSYDGKDRVLEISYTDRGKTYQIFLGKEGSKVYEDGSLTPTTKIETPWETWLAISKGEIRGDAALAQGLYTVNGDFNLMMHWGDFFGSQAGVSGAGRAASATGAATSPSGKAAKGNPTMAALLIPWMAFWISVSVNSRLGPIISLLVCASVPLIFYRRALTVYDTISFACVGCLSASSLIFGHTDGFVNLGYLCFGLLWLLSCFTKEPLCAAYVKSDYNGDDALQNPLFMKTNYILAAAWGILYIVISGVTFFLYKNDLKVIATIINNLAPILMGIFTGWFIRWYPARIASGKGRRVKGKF